MNIIRKDINSAVSFKDLKIGDIFASNQALYMRTNEILSKNMQYNSITLSDKWSGQPAWFDANASVVPKKATLTIEE